MTHRVRTGPIDDPELFVTNARAAVEDPKPGKRLRAIAALSEWLPVVERDAVEHAIASGASWARIADSLGVSRQAVHQKYAAEAREPGDSTRSRLVEQRAFEAAARAEVERAAQEHYERGRQNRRQAKA